MATRTIKVDYLARVEGEGALYVRIRDGRVEEVKLKIFEPPRLFEAFLRGRGYNEAHDITSRICGICPVAYQMSAVHAMEDALGIDISEPIRKLRRLFYCGEWIKSHALHVFLLHAPDFLGYEDAIRMSKDHPELVNMGLELKKAGNAIVAAVGGRDVHPVNVRVGGFYRAPRKQELAPLKEQLERGRETAQKTLRELSRLEFPDFQREYEFVSLRHPDEYPFNEGRIVSSGGLDVEAREFEDHFEESHEPHTTALHSVIKGRGAYFTGPMARYSLNFDRLSPIAREAAREAGLGPVCRNPFKSLLVRSVEILYAFDEGVRTIEGYEPPDAPYVEGELRAATGFACTEAPRGSLYHRYEIDEAGTIRSARIVPPTSQNQKTIEEDLRQYVTEHIDLPEERLTWECEQTIRNYDPCISCSTHFLKLKIDRE